MAEPTAVTMVSWVAVVVATTALAADMADMAVTVAAAVWGTDRRIGCLGG